ncbi:MAG: Hint domain-containing protein [Pseudodonghicola sp.]
MTIIPHSLTRAVKNATEVSPLLQDPAALRAHSRPQLRRYEISTLAPNGDIVDSTHIAPALPLFENAFCAFTRRSMVETDCGPVAVEDLLPGDMILTRDGQAERLTWKGCTTIVPGRPDARGRYHRLIRILADSFGMQTPMSDVLIGPSARLLKTPIHLRTLAGGNPLLTPVQEFVDGMNVIETAPPTAVQVYHLMLPRHAVIRVGGLEFETYHPGANAFRTTSPAMREIFLTLFPHLRDLHAFGPQAFARTGDGEINAIAS